MSSTKVQQAVLNLVAALEMENLRLTDITIKEPPAPVTTERWGSLYGIGIWREVQK